MSNLAQIQEDAARWLMTLDRVEPDSAEHKRFEAWLAADSRHRNAYLELERTWRSADGLKAWRPHDGSVDTLVLKTTRPATLPRRWQLAAAASVVLAVGAALVATYLPPFGGTTYRTDVGAYQRVQLGDGSLVQLNTDTRMKVRLEEEHRRVRLVQGEAHFDVAHDATRPFEVVAGQTLVKAVGTAFTVRVREARDVEVVVTEGAVMVTTNEGIDIFRADSTEPRSVTAGEIADAKSGSVEIRRASEPEIARRLAWRDGELIFEGMKLADVVDEFNRYNSRQLQIVDAPLADLKVGGNFRSTDVDGFVRALQASFPIRAAEVDDTISLSRRSGQ